MVVPAGSEPGRGNARSLDAHYGTERVLFPQRVHEHAAQPRPLPRGARGLGTAAEESASHLVVSLIGGGHGAVFHTPDGTGNCRPGPDDLYADRPAKFTGTVPGLGLIHSCSCLLFAQRMASGALLEYLLPYLPGKTPWIAGRSVWFFALTGLVNAYS